MASTVGRFNIVKKKLIALIKAADTSLNDSGSIVHVFGDWRLMTRYFRNAPVVTVRFSPVTYSDLFGRVLTGGGTPTEGAMASIAFSAHVFASITTTAGEEKGKAAQDLADKIVDYLFLHRYDATSGIDDIYGLKTRESEPAKGPRGLARVIIEGYILVERPD